MITLNPPHLALNDSRSNMTLSMTYSIAVTPHDSAGYIINRVVQTQSSPQLENVIFNCHGFPGRLQMGTGFSINQAPLFRRLRNKVKKIWFYACSPAANAIGRNFCAAVARNANCYVVAPTETQVETVQEMQGLPPGTLDTFEGLLLSFDPNGNINWHRRYPSTYTYHTGQYVANP